MNNWKKIMYQIKHGNQWLPNCFNISYILDELGRFTATIDACESVFDIRNVWKKCVKV